MENQRSENITRGSGSGDSSWVEVAQEKKVLKKYNLEIVDQEGEKTVEIPDDIINKANHLWDDYLIGKFLDTAPHIARVHAIVNKIWNLGDKSTKIEVHGVDETTMKFKVSNPVMRARILKRGMWNIGNIPLIMTKWTPNELKEKPEVKSIPLWVHLKNVPMNMFSWQGLSFITSAVGTPKHLHPETASCSNFKVAKIFVLADLSKELPRKINFTKEGISSLVEFSYPWLPPRCNKCGKWGHLEKACIVNAEKLVNQIKEGEIEMEEVRDTEVVRKEEEVRDENLIVEEMVQENTVEEQIEEGQFIEEWSEVTPGKGSKSPDLKYGEVRILTPSRFSTLLEVDESGDRISPIEIEEILSVEEEVIEEESTDEGETKIIEVVGDENKKEKVTIEEKIGEVKQTVSGIADIQNNLEHWPDLGASLRPSLPRKSKTQHKVIPEIPAPKHTPGKPGKRSYKPLPQ